MYHYGNTKEINYVLLVLKEFKGLKNEIINLYQDKLNDVMGYATGPGSTSCIMTSLNLFC